MRDYLERLRATVGLVEPGMLAVAILLLTSLVFFRVALLPEFGRDLSMTTLQLGAVTTVFALGRLLADLPGGHLADRYPARGLLSVSAAGLGVASLVMGLSQSTLPLYAAAMLLGVASSTNNATGMTYFSNVGGTALRGTSMAVFSAGLLGGQALGPAAAGLIATAADWRFAMFVAASVGALVSVTLAFTSERRAPLPAVEPSPTTADTIKGGGPSLGSMLVLQGVSFASFLTLGAVAQTLVPVVGSDELGLSAAGLGLALGAGGLARFVGTLVGGRLSDLVSRKTALVPGLLVQAAGVGLLTFRPTPVLFVTAIVVMSLASFAIPVAATIVGDLAVPGGVGKQLGRFRFAGDLGLISGPLLVSGLYQQWGREVAFSAVAGILTLSALVSFRLLPETGADS
ncbi:MAG: MFS transporter [Acidimicrobiia bacterium]